MMNALIKILLIAFIATAFTSCIARKNPHDNWYKRHHYKQHYKKGNNFGGRRLWVRYF